MTARDGRITYSVAGKGTFVHPDAFDLLRGAALQEPIADPELRAPVAAYLAEQQAITRRFHAARTHDDRNAALNDLLRHADTHGQLIDDAIKYQIDHGNYAHEVTAHFRLLSPSRHDDLHSLAIRGLVNQQKYAALL